MGTRRRKLRLRLLEALATPLFSPSLSVRAGFAFCVCECLSVCCVHHWRFGNAASTACLPRKQQRLLHVGVSGLNSPGPPHKLDRNTLGLCRANCRCKPCEAREHAQHRFRLLSSGAQVSSSLLKRTPGCTGQTPARRSTAIHRPEKDPLPLTYCTLTPICAPGRLRVPIPPPSALESRFITLKFEVRYF